MGVMKEFDTRAKAKELAEFITPPALRQFMAEEVKGEELDLLDVSIGSGQLLFDFTDRIAHVTGYDVNAKALAAATQNFSGKCDLRCQDYITAEDDAHHGVCVCNYPFSLRPTEAQKISIKGDPFLSQFYGKNVTGVLDFPFILKSFDKVEEGYYLCFPGIGYRGQESTFRRYLIEHKFIREYGLLTNCKFEHTSISILYLHLSKIPCDEPGSFTLDFKTGERYDAPADFEGDNFIIPAKPVAEEVFDPVQLEREARADIERRLRYQYNFSEAVWQMDESVRRVIAEPPRVWLKNMVSRVSKKYRQTELFK